MAVDLTISKTIDFAAVIADDLSGSGAPKGLDFGQAGTGSYSPVTDKVGNTGRYDVFVKHNAVTDPITDLRLRMQQYGLGTAYIYDGDHSAALDISDFFTAQGQASGGSKNNGDGNSGGLWLDMNAIIADSQNSAQFNYTTNGYNPTGGSNGGDDTVRIFGKNSDGMNVANGILIKSKAMVTAVNQSLGGDGVNGYVPTAPEDGKLGKAADNAKGNICHLKLRTYARNDTALGGLRQFELVFGYNFTG